VAGRARSAGISSVAVSQPDVLGARGNSLCRRCGVVEQVLLMMILDDEVTVMRALWRWLWYACGDINGAGDAMVLSLVH
jgi:hypothetical protein